MSIQSNGSGSYEVHISAAMAQQIKNVYQIALSKGLHGQFLTALQSMHARLTHEAEYWGEPLFHLKALGLQVRVAIALPIAVHFGVNSGLRKVYLSKVQLFAPS